jgi:hypothetical protein
MNINKLINPSLILLLLSVLTFILLINFKGDITKANDDFSNYNESGTFNGTVEHKQRLQKMLIIKTLGIKSGKVDEKIYKIPVENIKQYEIGQKLEVKIYSKTNTDVWNSKKMKFKVRILEQD